MTGERFIPFRTSSVVTMCANEVPAEERESFQAFTELLASLMHQEFRTRLESLKDTYHPFNPDTDARTVVELTAAERQAAQVRLVDELTALAEDANFERISADDLGRAFAEESLMKVRLEADFDDFEQVVFYRRGVRTRQEEVKHLFGLRRRTIEFGIPAALGAALAAFGGFLVRQYTKFKNRKIQFMKALSENLYFRNLDNDAGVFHHLLDAAEEEEAKEAVLGVGKLRRLRLIDDEGPGRLTAVPLEEAKRRLDQTWDDLFAYNSSRAAEA